MVERETLRDHIRFIFRGELRELNGFSPTRSLLDWLREDQRSVGTKEGCNEGDCGACTVVLARLEDGRLEHGKLVHRPVNACITFLGMVDGAEIITVEDLAKGGKLHPIQQAMVEHHGSQCGFCTPGIVMSLFAMDQDGSPVTRERVNDQLAGNLCRCTGYRPIMDAALASVGKGEQRVDHAGVERLAKLSCDAGAIVSAGDGFFAAPRTLAELLDLYAQHPDATILAGATDVGLWITKQFRPVTKLIWLGRVSELQHIQEKDGEVTMGAGVTHETALPYLAALSPDLGELGRRFGSKQVRAQGTVGGNIANGSPIGDWAPAFIALGAKVSLRSRDGERTLPLEDFFISYGKQDRKSAEIVESIWLPKPRTGVHFRCFKISKRFDEDISALMGAFQIVVGKAGIMGARVAFGGMAATPKRGRKTETALIGASLADRHSWEAALDTLADDFQPIDDMRASARYRMETARALLTKALIEIGGGEGTRLSPPPAMAAE